MKLLLDTANIENIKKLSEIYEIAGVTTNPTILSKESEDPLNRCKKIKAIIGKKELHVQVISKDKANIIEEARFIVSYLGENTFVKIPVTIEGLKAIKVLAKENINITATAIYMPMQGILAANNGARYLAPYINRIDNLGYDGIKVAKEINDFLLQNKMPTEVLAASFKNSMQVLRVLQNKITTVTVSPDMIEKLLFNPTVDQAVETFQKDFYKSFKKNSMQE